MFVKIFNVKLFCRLSKWLSNHPMSPSTLCYGAVDGINVYTYVYVYIYIYIYVHTCIHAYIYMYSVVALHCSVLRRKIIETMQLWDSMSRSGKSSTPLVPGQKYKQTNRCIHQLVRTITEEMLKGNE